ncbi:MAG: FG-GAP-like repeat-containing protein, partial [Fuerstiella sp.]
IESKPGIPAGRRGLVVLIILSIVAAVAYISSSDRDLQSPPAQVDWASIQQAENRQDYMRALELCIELGNRDPSLSAETNAYASEIASGALGQFRRGESLARIALSQDPENRRARANLVRLMTMTGQRWKSLPHLAQFVVRFDDSLQELIWLSDASVVITDWDLLKTARINSPDDPLPVLGLAFDAVMDQPQNALLELQECLRRDPDMKEAQALMGRALVDAGDEDGFRRWNSDMAPQCEEHPEVWNARGLWWQNRDRAAALRCYLECCRRAPGDAQANLQISLLLDQIGESAAASVFRARFEQISAYRDLIRAVRERNDLSVALKAAHLAEQLQRPAEALGWCRVALQHGQTTRKEFERLSSLQTEWQTVAVSSFDPDGVIDRHQWSVPTLDQTLPDTQSAASRSFGIPRFRNITDTIGLNFEYFNSVEKGTRLEFLHTVNGGGVAAVDFDGDSWPDLFFTQGGYSPEELSRNTTYSDKLFRNRNGVRASDVTAVAGITEFGYGQGCTVGDFDGDGFQDIMIANIGRNRLFQNCGDGTFLDVTDQAGIVGDAWTSSLALADLNSDSWPDLYEVRYVHGEDLFLKQCHATDQLPRPCPPKEYAAAADVVWMNSGDGHFFATSDTVVDSDAGRGLGLIVANFDQLPGLDVFVGNDGTADFLFVNRTMAGGETRFRNEGTLRGLSANGRGAMQATMGMTFGDINRDGEPDLFQSNFLGQSNTLYLGSPNGYFNDATIDAGLHKNSLPLVGWGTEFLDADLDGWLDLVVVNGHLEDRTRFGDSYRMLTRIYRNSGHGRFLQVAPAKLGKWFQEVRLGRSLATLDWNRDGLADFAVSNLDSAAALLIGETSPTGNYIKVHLRAVDSARDAIGTDVIVESANHRCVHQLVCGDGYQTSNERTVIAGLGTDTLVEQMTIRWPSGRLQTLKSFSVNQEIFIVEGREPRQIRGN